MKSLPRVDLQSVFTFLIPFLLFSLLVDRTQCAPAVEGDDVDGGCYYMFNHYGEGDRILTNEPCLNCTCHNSMLMCYLRVCPFTKPIGQDCTIEKKPDQCCPVISCPQVPVSLVTPSALTSTTVPTTSLASVTGSTELAPFERGCEIEGKNYPDGAQVIGDPTKPCELCYCIRNRTACVMQECILHVEGCEPVFQAGVCCPVRYQCDYPQITDQSTVAGLITTTISSLFSTPPVPGRCLLDGEYYADGSQIPAAGRSPSPCEHCYCMRGEIVCAVQECGTPLENEGANCTAIPPGPGLCCPDKYTCESDIDINMDEPGTTLGPLDPAVSIPESQSPGAIVSSTGESTLESQTEAIPVSVEPFESSTDATKDMDTKVESATGQSDTSIGSESSTIGTVENIQSSSTTVPEHDMIINEPSTNETDLETHSRVSERPSTSTSADLEDENFDSSVTSQKPVSEDIQPSEILADDKTVLSLENNKNMTSDQETPEAIASITTEKTVAEPATNAPEYTTTSPGSMVSEDTSVPSHGSQPEEIENSTSPSDAPSNDDVALLGSSTERVSASSEQSTESSPDNKLLESSTENVLVVSDDSKLADDTLAMNTEQDSTESPTLSSKNPNEGSTETSEISLGVSTENSISSTSEQSSSTEGEFSSSTSKSIESSTENNISSNESSSESTSEQTMAESPLGDKPAEANQDESLTSTSSVGPMVPDSEISVTTNKIPTGEQSASDSQNDESNTGSVSDEGSGNGSQTTAEEHVTGSSIPSEKDSDAPSMDGQDSLGQTTTTKSTGPIETDADNEKNMSDEAHITSTASSSTESSSQSGASTENKIAPQLSGTDQNDVSSTTDKAIFTTISSSIIEDGLDISSSVSPPSESQTTQKPSLSESESEDQQESMGHDDKQTATESQALEDGASSSSSTATPETVTVSESDKESELASILTSSKPVEHEGIVMGEFTVSSTPEGPESLSMHKTSTYSPNAVPSGSTAGSVLPSGSEADNEIGGEAAEKISDDAQPDNSDITSKPPSSTTSSEQGLSPTSDSTMSGSPAGVAGQDGEETTKNSLDNMSQDHPGFGENTTGTPAGNEIDSMDSQKMTETPTVQGGDKDMSGDKVADDDIKPDSDKPSESSVTSSPINESDNEQNSIKLTETPILPADSDSDVDKTTRAPVETSSEGNASDSDKPTETPEKLSDSEMHADGHPETSNKLAGEGTESEKTTETPMQISESEDKVHMDKVTEVPEKLSGEGIGSDLATENPEKLSDENSEATETPSKLAGMDQDSEKSTETSIKLEGQSQGSDFDKTTASSLNLTEDDRETTSDKTTESPMKLSNDANAMNMATESPIKLNDQDSESDLSKPTETPVKLDGDGNVSEIDKMTENPTKVSSGQDQASDLDNETENPMKLSDANSDSGLGMATETPVKSTDGNSDSELATTSPIKTMDENTDPENSTETPIKSAGENMESDKVTETPVNVQGENTDSEKVADEAVGHITDDKTDSEHITETPVKMTGENKDSEMVTETPGKITGESMDSEKLADGTAITSDDDKTDSDKVTETPVKMAGENVDSEKSTETPVKLVGESMDSEKATETPAQMTGEMADSESTTETPVKMTGEMADSDKTPETPVKLAGEMADSDKATEASIKLSGENIDSEKSTETPVKMTGESMDTEKATEIPVKMTGESMDSEKTTEAPVKMIGESMGSTETPVKIDDESMGSTETPVKMDDESMDSEKATESPVKMTGDSMDSEKATETPVKLTGEAMVSVQGADTPIKLDGESMGSDVEKATEISIKLGAQGIGSDMDANADVDNSTETTVKLSDSIGSDLDESTQTPPKPTEDNNNAGASDSANDKQTNLDNEYTTESIVKPVSNHQDENEIEKSPEDHKLTHDQAQIENNTEMPTKLSGDGNEMHHDQTTGAATGSEAETTEKAIEVSSQKPLSADDTEKSTESSSPNVPSHDETDIVVTETPSVPENGQNQLAGETVAATSTRPETVKEDQSDSEKVIEVPLQSSNVQPENAMINDDPSKPIDGETAMEKVSAGEGAPTSDAMAETDGTETTHKPMLDDHDSAIKAEQTTTSLPTFGNDKPTTPVVPQLDSDSSPSGSVSSNDNENTGVTQMPETATKLSADLLEGVETTQTPDVSAVHNPEQTPVHVGEQVGDATTQGPETEGVTSSINKESATHPSNILNTGSEDGVIHDQPSTGADATEVPTSVSVSESDGSLSMTTVASESNGSPTTLRPHAVGINGSDDVMTASTIKPDMDNSSSTKVSAEGITEESVSQDDANTESSVSNNIQNQEFMGQHVKNLTDAELVDNLTTIKPSHDSEGVTTSIPDVEGNSTDKPLHGSEMENNGLETNVTTEAPIINLSGVADMSEIASDKLSDDSSIDMTSTEDNSTQSQTRVPGEGNCYVEGKTYKNGSSIPPTTPCHIVCACQNSIVHCLLVHCPPPPNNYGDCKPIYRSGVCCPEYDCDGSDDSAVTVTPGPALGFTKEDLNFVTVTPETPSLPTNDAQDESFLSDALNTTDSITNRPFSISQSTESSESVSQESEENKSSTIGSVVVKPFEDPSQETSSDVEDSSQNYLSSTFASSLVSEMTSSRPMTSEDKLDESANATGVGGSLFVSSESPESVPSSPLSSAEEGILDASKLEESLNITSDSDSSSVPSGSYYPVTTTTSVTPSSAAWPYPASTPSSVMSTGACLFDGRVYMSAQQIPRDDPCDFCFCFRGDIICLQQSCPPPIPGCYEEPIPGFCCPRYECPVGNGNVTTEQPLFPPSYYHNQILNGVASGQNPGAVANMPSGPGCEIQGEYYESGQVITSTSGPCLECRCGATGMMECDPRECQPEPMLRKMIAAITSR